MNCQSFYAVNDENLSNIDKPFIVEVNHVHNSTPDRCDYIYIESINNPCNMNVSISNTHDQ